MIEILAALVSILIGGLLPLLQSALKPSLIKLKKKNPDSKTAKILSDIFSIKVEESTPYKTRIQDTLTTLQKASSEIDKATTEINSLMKTKQETIEKLEQKLTELSTKETELSEKIKTLQKVPIEAVDYFETMLNKGDKRSAYRDYLLFGLGVIVSVIVTIILKKIGY